MGESFVGRSDFVKNLIEWTEKEDEVSKFKVGDKVICVRNIHDLRLHKEYTIEEVRSDDFVKVQGRTGSYDPTRFKLASEKEDEVKTNKFKNGDRVKCVDDRRISSLVLHKEYTVGAVFDNGDVAIEGVGSPYRGCRFELVTETGTNKYKVGDKVFCTNNHGAEDSLSLHKRHTITEVYNNGNISLNDLAKVFDPRRFELVTETGIKADSEKLDWSLLDGLYLAMEEVVKSLDFGAKKYTRDNWKKVVNLKNRYKAAARRHEQKYLKGEIFDKESKAHHLAVTALNYLFLAQADLEERGGK